LNINSVPELSLFPLTAEVNRQGHLCVGGCDVVDLVKEYGTPLYLFDEFTIRHKCREFKAEFSQRYPDTLVSYASKAFLNRALALILNQENLALDVVSGGELSIAHSVGFPLAKIYFHGNNKTPEELELALNWGIGRVVVDNFYELELLEESGYGQKEVFWQVAQAISEILPHGDKEKQLLQGFLYGKQSYVGEQALGQQAQLF
jgi:diaminopimelate decarboxylase